MNVRQVDIVTNASGAFSKDVRVQGEVLSIALQLGTLDTPDITITDSLTDESIFAVSGQAASGTWQPRRLQTNAAGVDLAAAAGPPAVDNVYGPTVCFGTAEIVVAGGGANKTGTLYIAYRG